MSVLAGNRKAFLILSFILTAGFSSAGADPGRGLKFIPNRNQWSSEIQFAARIPGGKMILQPGGFGYYFYDAAKVEELHHSGHSGDADGNRLHEERIDAHFTKVRFEGADASVVPSVFGRSSEYYNYFLGNDRSQWATRVHAYEGVYYANLYPGIDLKVYSSGAHGKYDWIVAPNADPSQILVRYDGSGISEENGNIIVKNYLAEIIEQKPFAYQWIDGKKVQVPCEYVLSGSTVRYAFPFGYDPCHPLVIDPILIFSTFSGSTADNWGSTATPGERGTLYSSGVTNHHVGNQNIPPGTFPATAGAFQTEYGGQYDIGILKYDSAGGQLLYASYLGGFRSESPHSLIVDKNNDLIVLGTTGSTDFPTTGNAFDQTFNGGSTTSVIGIGYPQGSDIVVVRISQDGDELLGSTFLGGTDNDGMNRRESPLTRNYGDELRGDVITDTLGNIFISSVTASADFPVHSGFENNFHFDDQNPGTTDAVVAKLSPDLSSVVWASYLGGTGFDASYSIKFDTLQNIYLAGGTTSSDFPVTPGAYDAQHNGSVDGWIAKIAHDGSSILKSTFTGTSSYDQVYFVDLNSNLDVYAYGQTNGTFPISADVFRNANSGQFLQKFSNDLSSLVFSTVFGSGRGSPDISPTAFLVNDCNNVYMTGWGGGSTQLNYWGGLSSTIGMQTSRDAFQRTTSGNDFYFIVLTDDAKTFLYGTYMGGAKTMTHVDGGTSRFDKSGIVYHSVCAGCNTDGDGPKSDFPTSPGAWSRTNRSTFNCNNAAFKFDLASLRAALQTNTVSFDYPGVTTFCIEDKVRFQNISLGGVIYEWDLGDGTTVSTEDTTSFLHEYAQEGPYTVSLKAIDQGTCKVADSASVDIQIFQKRIIIQDDDDLCEGTPYTLQADGGETYHWMVRDSGYESFNEDPLVHPADTTMYEVTVIDVNGCIKEDTVLLNVIPNMKLDFEMVREDACAGLPDVTITNQTDSLMEGDEMTFDFGDGTVSTELEAAHTYTQQGLFQVKLSGQRSICYFEKTLALPLFELTIPNIITPDGDGRNDTFSIRYGAENGVTPAAYNYRTSVVIYNRWGIVVFRSDDYQYDWSAEGLATGVYYYEVTVEDHATCRDWLHVIRGE